jgi:SAM-dependent methyltransferase
MTPRDPEHASRIVQHNREAHDAVGAGYDRGHPEIFNETEQQRLAMSIRRAVRLVRQGGSHPVRALDVGCGTGNLTAHLIQAGATVTASDLSGRFLEIVRERFVGKGLDGTQPLNGTDLRPLGDGTFDLVATYSVLHHVPDYLTLVHEMARVTAPGGIVLIDHERSEASWSSPELAAFLREAVVWPARRWWYWLQPSRYWRRIRPLLEWRRWGNPRWMPEGDLHIWPDDHIEWSKVEAALVEAGCEVVARETYLLFEPRYRREAWERWKERCADMQLLIMRKRA